MFQFYDVQWQNIFFPQYLASNNDKVIRLTSERVRHWTDPNHILLEIKYISPICEIMNVLMSGCVETFRPNA